MVRKQHLYWTGALAVVLGLSAWLLLATAAQSEPGTPAAGLTRTLEPVILTGDQLWLLNGAALDDLFVYAYTGGTWAPIPFQFDEVDVGGAYTVEDGQLDGNDELVLMAMDLGEEAGPAAWIPDADSQNHPRYQVQVTNPLQPGEEGWAYVYRSATLAGAPPADYADWDAAHNRVVAGSYTLGFSPTVHAGVGSLELNQSGVDALDRTKIRLNAICYIPLPLEVTLTEEDLAGLLGAAPNVDGPVRVGGGGADGGWWFYHSLYRLHTVLAVDDFEPPPLCNTVDINWLRLSNDWLDPAATGMAPATYYDSNVPGGVPVDGIPDSVPQTPATPWQQVSGAQGSTVQVMDITLGGGSLSTYYKDDQNGDSDTGDGKSFGDAGLRVDNPAGQANIQILTFILGPDQPNVGATYQAYAASPLQVAAVAQGVKHTVYLPLLFRAYP